MDRNAWGPSLSLRRKRARGLTAEGRINIPGALLRCPPADRMTDRLRQACAKLYQSKGGTQASARRSAIHEAFAQNLFDALMLNQTPLDALAHDAFADVEVQFHRLQALSPIGRQSKHIAAGLFG